MIQTAPNHIDSVTPGLGLWLYGECFEIPLKAQRYVQCPEVWVFDHWEGDVMDPNSAEVAKSTIDVLLDTQKPQQMDIVINAGDNRIDFSVKYVPDVSKGKVNRLFVLASDVTERKRADESRATALDEASRMNRLMSGREMRVIEMKKETNALLNELGRHAKYGSVEQ